MWLYGMAQFQRHKNRSLIANAGISRPLATPHRCTKAPTGNHGRYTWPTSVTQKGGFPQFLLTHTKGFSLLTPQRSHPNTFRMDFPLIWYFNDESALRK